MIIHDQMKEQYCLDNDIPLLKLDYSLGFCGTKLEEWNEKIKDFIKEISDSIC